MAWDARRPVPWKRMGIFLGLYAGVMLVVSGVTNRDKMGPALVSVVFGIVVATSFLVILTKFGWTMPILRSREEIAATRTQRLEAKAARKRGSTPVDTTAAGPKPKAAPTRRTTTGPSQRPRSTGSARRK